MRRLSLSVQVFLSILGVALGTALTVGLFARVALSSAFDAYLATLPSRIGGMGHVGAGRMMLGTAEQAFVSSVDRGVLWAAVVAVAIAAAVALLLAAYLNRPLRRLEAAAEGLAQGDLTQRVDAEGPLEVASLGDAFNRMADSLESAEELRRRMVADVAHELRNPVAAARAQAEGMAEGVIAADTERLDSLVEDLHHLSTLIDDLQELAVAEAGRLRYDMGTVDVVELARREADRVSAALAPGVALRFESANASEFVRGDARRLGQVLRNVLSNASRHTDSGTVTVEVSEAADRVVVRVIDTGEGIDPAEVSHIFERFYRADAARASYTGGAGLGLAISRAIVHDHGGEMFAESVLREGTTVGFSLPRVSEG
jgi:signal transduction histidine kinase